MGSELRLRLLGKPRLARDGVPLAGLALRKSVALLAYLAVTGRTHDRGALAGLLWGEATESNARASLRKVLAELRRQVPDHLLISRSEVALDRASPCWLDVETFEQQASRALMLCDGLLADAAALEEAIELVRGDFLEGFQVRGAPAFEEWVLLEREHLQLLCIRGLQALLDYCAGQGAYARALTYADRLLALEPAQEAAHRTRMSLLARSGQREAALRQYQACCGALARLDAEPDGETVALYRRIRAGVEVPAPHRTPPHNLPAPLTPLIGREAELAEIGARLRDPACRLLTLIGPGGCGKTRLALAAAATMRSAGGPLVQGPLGPQPSGFDDGIFFVPLVAASNVEALAPTVAQALHMPLSEREPADRSSARGQLLDFVRRKRLLLVLDGFEHLLAGADLVEDLLRASPAVKILVTSRARLNLSGEHLYRVGGLARPEGVPGDGETLASCAAVRLFVSSARRIQPGFEVTEDGLADVAQICHLVGRLPLGILLAAGWAGMLSPGQIAGRLSRDSGWGLDLLEADRYDLPARQRSMRAVFDHSWHLLTEREQQVLGALSVLRGSFDEAAAGQVAGASLRELRSLVDKSMLHQASRGRYQLHDLLRQYAAEKLQEVPGAVEAARDRHSAHFAATVQARTAALKGPRQEVALAEIRAASENVRAAWGWAAERGQVACLDQIMDGLCYYHKWSGRYEEGHRLCQTAVERLSAQDPSSEAIEDRLRVVARCLAWQGVFSQWLGHSALANRLLWQSLNLLNDPAVAGPETRSERAFALWRLGRLTIDSDRQGARGLCQQSLALYRALGDRWGAANALNALGELTWNLGAYEEARSLFEECLATRRALEDQRGIADALGSLSRLALYQGRIEESERLLQQSVALCRRTGNRIGLADGLLRSGRTSGFLGQFARARSQIEEAVAIYHDLGGRVPMAGVHLSAAYLHLGQYKEARAQALMALERCKDTGFSRGVGLAHWLLGREALAREAFDEAQGLLQRSVAILEEIGQQDEGSSALATLGLAAWRCGRPSRAWGYQFEALQTAAEIRAFVPLTIAMPALALLLASQGKPGQAMELYALVTQQPYVANSRWFDDVVGKQMASVAASLPSAAAAAAQERGRKQDLWDTVAELLAELGEGQ
jgi:predicted ATPase/DNA-binding SARP family transcriptional activator